MISRTILLVFSLTLSSGLHFCTFSPSQQRSSYPPSLMRVVKGSELPSLCGFGQGKVATKRASLAVRTLDTKLLVDGKRDSDGTNYGVNENEDISSYSNLQSSYFALGALLFTFVSNQWARQSIYYLCDFSPDATAFKHINIGKHKIFLYASIIIMNCYRIQFSFVFLFCFVV